VNEAIQVEDGREDGLRKTPLLELLGPDYIEIGFRAARVADPKALLCYNVYGLDYDTPGQERKRAAVLALLRRLKDRKVPIDALGTQAHLDWASQKDFKAETLQRFLGEVAALGLQIFITELDGSVIQINNDGTWTRNGPYSSVTPTPVICPYPFFFGMPTDDVCPGAPVTTNAAYQPYDRGFMIWVADSGDIWVFVNAPAPNIFATYAHFNESDYAGFADAAPQQPPPGKVQPINGFGRVWYNLTHYATGNKISADLGWATAPESSYSTTRQAWGRTSHSNVYLSVPNGGVIDAYQGLAGIHWTWAK
jgi:hypothetical protein